MQMLYPQALLYFSTRKRVLTTVVLNILYQFNEKYAPYAGVSIFSLLENNKAAEQINIYIIEENLKKSSKDKITQMIHSYNRSVNFLDGKKIIAFVKELGIPEYRGSYATNLKMFAPLYLQEDIEKLLYIDSDTLVLGDLQSLFKSSSCAQPLEMALDSLAVRHKRYIGHSKNDLYYNAGVILIDLKSWNKHSCTQKIIDHAKHTRSHYMAPDQDMLNVALKPLIGLMDIKYNLQPIHYKYSYKLYRMFWKQPAYYGKQEIDAAVRNPVIIHFFRFLGEFPWDLNSDHPYADLYRTYLEKSPWKDRPQTGTQQDGFVFRLERWMYRHLPDPLFMLIFRICYDMFLSSAEAASRKGKNHHQM